MEITKNGFAVILVSCLSIAEDSKLDKFSKEIYGDIFHVSEICEVNGLEDGNLIFIGQKLLLP